MMQDINKDDLCVTIELAGGGTVHIYDTYCKTPMTKEEKEAVDGRILTIFARALLRQKFEEAKLAEPLDNAKLGE